VRASSPGTEGEVGLPCAGRFTTNHLETEIDIQERLPTFYREVQGNAEQLSFPQTVRSCPIAIRKSEIHHPTLDGGVS
jgi:hypothetical protein